MADPTPRAFAAATQSGTSVSLTMPAGAQVGDTVVLIGSGYGTAAGMTPSGGTSGWTQIALAPDTTSPFGGTCRFKAWVRDTKVQPGEPGSQSLGVVQSINDQCNVGVAIFGDCDPADLVDGTVSYVTSADTSAGTITAGQVTTTVSNAVILRLLMSWGGGPVSGWSVLSGSATEQADTGTWDRFAIYADVQASAGASATPSFSAAGSSGRIQAITLAIKGASSATPVESSISQGLRLTQSVEAAATIVPPTVYAGEDLQIFQGQSPNRAGVIVSTGGGTIVPESISWSIAAPPPPGHGLITSQPDPLDVVHTVAGTYTWRFQARNEAGFGTDIFLLHVSAVPAATIEQGLLLTHSVAAEATAAAEVQASASQGLLLTHAVTASAETSASLAHGVLLSQDVAATVTAEASASHGLLLTQSVSAEAVVESTVTEGLLLSQAVTADVDTDPYGLVLVEAHQGILLGHDVTVQVEEPSATPVEAAIVQGLTLTQDAAVSMTLEASVSQGLTLTQDAAALAGDPVAATIAQGLALYQQVATQAEVSAQLAHGLRLTQSVSAGSDPAPAIAQGFLLAQAVQASLLVTAAAAHGIVITQDVSGVNHVDVEASIAQGILLRHRVRVGERSGGNNLATFGRLLRP